VNGSSPPSDDKVVNSIYLTIDILLTVIAWLTNEMSYDLVIVVMAAVSRNNIAKYMIHRLSPPNIAANIHPVWFIDMLGSFIMMFGLSLLLFLQSLTSGRLIGLGVLFLLSTGLALWVQLSVLLLSTSSLFS
jgi:hypothetical protein